MHRGIGGVSLGLFGLRLGLGLGLMAELVACAAPGGDEGILVLSNVKPQAGCTTTAMVNEIGVARGAVDAQFHTGYLFFAQLKSRITALAGQEDQRVIFTRGANIDITFPDSTLFTAAELDDLSARHLLHFMSPFTADISPNGGITDVPFELIPAELVEAAAAKPGFSSVTAQTTFTVVGDLAGENTTSQQYLFSVTLLSDGFLHDLGPCSVVPKSFTPRVGNSCNPGQDGAVDCCSNLSGEICPAVGTM